MPKVYVVNNSSHDFSAAEEYGDITFLSEGPMSRYGTNNMIRVFKEAFEGSTSGDYLVPCSLNIMNLIASALFAHKHGRLNLLLFKDGGYVVRNHVF